MTKKGSEMITQEQSLADDEMRAEITNLIAATARINAEAAKKVSVVR